MVLATVHVLLGVLFSYYGSFERFVKDLIGRLCWVRAFGDKASSQKVIPF
jgi:hypothetical protein